MASPYIPTSRCTSPRIFIRRPPPTPISEAEVYLVAMAGDCAPPAVTLDVADAAEGVRENGDGMAEKRLVGLDAAAVLASGGFGDTDGWIDVGWAEVGLPPGVRARFPVIPMPLDNVRVSAECECAIVGVDVSDREGMSCGVLVRIGKRSEYCDWADTDVRDGRSVDDSVFSPLGVSRAVTYSVSAQLPLSGHLLGQAHQFP
jgi:hypothetical protein